MKEEAGRRELRLVEAAMVTAPEADLLEETETLIKEKVEVQRQAEKENSDLLKQMKLLEAELEEQVNRVIELEHARTTQSGDLQQQIQALEKHLPWRTGGSLMSKPWTENTRGTSSSRRSRN